MIAGLSVGFDTPRGRSRQHQVAEATSARARVRIGYLDPSGEGVRVPGKFLRERSDLVIALAARQRGGEALTEKQKGPEREASGPSHRREEIFAAIRM
ncbi:MAG: hypothetical protein ACM3IK_03535 [Sphingomonadaceae bacterium]